MPSVTEPPHFLVPQASVGSLLEYALIFSAYIGLTAVVARSAARRGGSGVAWFVIGLFLGPVGWLLCALTASRRPRKRAKIPVRKS